MRAAVAVRGILLDAVEKSIAPHFRTSFSFFISIFFSVTRKEKKMEKEKEKKTGFSPFFHRLLDALQTSRWVRSNSNCESS